MMMVLRDAKLEDAPAIVSLVRELSDSSEGISPLTIDSVARHLLHPFGRILLAEWKGEVAGLLSYALRLSLWHAAPCCYIEDLVVHERFRGRGIGTALIQRVFELAGQEGYAEISLSVSEENSRAQNLYKRLGLDEQSVYLAKHLSA